MGLQRLSLPLLCLLSAHESQSSWIPAIPSSFVAQSISSTKCEHDSFAEPTFWKRADGTGSWSQTTQDSAAKGTFRWCTNFVLPLNLCPWAARSIQSENAIQIYVVDEDTGMLSSIESAALTLLKNVDEGVVEARVAISFIVCRKQWDFADFYAWFEELEEQFWEDERFAETITLAPFHPDWQFEGEDPALMFEKKSPYPTVTVVCTSVVDAAGEEATRQIAHHNEMRLLEEGAETLRKLYRDGVNEQGR